MFSSIKTTFLNFRGFEKSDLNFLDGSVNSKKFENFFELTSFSNYRVFTVYNNSLKSKKYYL